MTKLFQSLILFGTLSSLFSRAATPQIDDTLKTAETKLQFDASAHSPRLSNLQSGTSVNLREHISIIDFEYVPSVATTFEIRTPWKLIDAQGADFIAISHESYRITLRTAASTAKTVQDKFAYQHGQIVLTFASN
jgi:hypothetical protein